MTTEAPSAAPAEAPAERVCVVIWGGTPKEAELRRQLGESLPLRLVLWQDRTYLAVIEQLRPRVIVAVEPEEEAASDVAGLLACLVTTYTPTVIAMTPGARQNRRPSFVVRQLGPRETARLASFADLRFA